MLGSDSTTTYFVGTGNPRHFNCARKVFEVGENSTLGIVTWGIASFPTTSYRTLLAQFADELVGHPVKSVQEVADRWGQKVWPLYCQAFDAPRRRCAELSALTTRNPAEEAELTGLRQTGVLGFIVGGYVYDDRTPRAFEIRFDFSGLSRGLPIKIGVGQPVFRGVPNFMDRLLKGMDDRLYESIIFSGKWMGSRLELTQLVHASTIALPPIMPVREALDWVYSSIYTTIKALKFSHLPRWCGGPVELAVITSDRRFRWVRHKVMDAAVGENYFVGKKKT